MSETENAIWSLVLSVMLIASLIQEAVPVTVVTCFMLSYIKFDAWRTLEERKRWNKFYFVSYLTLGVAYILMYVYFGALT
jgi:hypothetical protein